jgi:hypothetical protein
LAVGLDQRELVSYNPKSMMVYLYRLHLLPLKGQIQTQVQRDPAQLLDRSAEFLSTGFVPHVRWSVIHFLPWV